MKPLIQKLPNKLSVNSNDQNTAKVHIISKKARLTQRCDGNANGQVISERLNNKPIVCRHLTHGFITIIHNLKSLGVYKK